MPQFTIELTEESLESLTFLRKHEQVVVLDAIELQLASEPVTETRNRKPLRPNELSQWELRVGHLRAFYNVDMWIPRRSWRSGGKNTTSTLFVERSFSYEDH